jgi:glycosyltransferase involved in cell wall biosynthesis
MRLLLVMPSIASYRGFFRELCRDLAADGVEVHVACWPGRSSDTEAGCAQLHSIPFARGMNPIAHFRAAWELRRLVSSIHPDLIHVNFAAAVFTSGMARISTWPMTIATFHGVSFPIMRGLKRTLVRAMAAWGARRHDAVWVLNEDDRRQLHAAAPDVDVRLMKSCGVGCDLESFYPASVAHRESLRAEFGFPAGSHVFAYIGRNTAAKGFDLTVRAFLRLARENPSARLLLAGGGDTMHKPGLTTAEQQELMKSSQVVDLGFCDDVERCIAAADVMVLPSRREGMPVAIMEALAMGVPVITRDVCGCRDVVRDGVDGLVLRECSVEPLYAAMKRVAEDRVLRAQLSAQAVAGRNRLSRDRFIAEQKQIYTTCVPVRCADALAAVS